MPLYICKLIHTQIQFNRFLSILVPDNSNKIEKAYKSVQNNKNYKFEIYKIQGIKSPCITGLIHPKILLPEMDFTEKELQYILLQEEKIEQIIKTYHTENIIIYIATGDELAFVKSQAVI